MKNVWILICIISLKSFAQENNGFKLSGFAEVYFVRDFSNPSNNTRAGFLYNHTRTNEVTPNLAFLKGTYTQAKVRANVAIMVGTYAQFNLAAEPELLRNIYEANVGIKLSKKSDLWLDAGIFASHIGFESAVSKDCWTLTRSMLAENSPYYESGVKVSYNTPNGKWTLVGLILNGWQRIRRIDGNTTMAWGTQLQYKPTASITFNSSTFIGNDKPNALKQMRYFHNFFCMLQLKKTGVIVGFDYGLEQKTPRSSSMNSWYSPVVILRQKWSEKWATAIRWETYQDPNGVIINTNTANGFDTSGTSINIDYSFLENVLFRAEGKYYTSKAPIFEGKTDNFAVTTSLAISF